MNDYRDLGLGFLGAVLTLAAYIGLAGVCFGADAGEPLTATIVQGDDTFEGRYFPQTGDRVVIHDMSYIVLTVHDWELWTNRIAKLEAVAERRWANEHKTDAGRRAWHGAVVKTELVDDGRAKVVTYADGYTWTEKGTPSRPNVRRAEAIKNATTTAPSASKAKTRANLPPRLRAKREAIDAQPAARTVNATFSAGGGVTVTGEK